METPGDTAMTYNLKSERRKSRRTSTHARTEAATKRKKALGRYKNSFPAGLTGAPERYPPRNYNLKNDKRKIATHIDARRIRDGD